MSVLRQLRIPHMGSVENARFIEWSIAEGESFSAEQPLYEVETDKTLTEVTALEAGILARRSAVHGAQLKVGDAIGWWAPADTSAEDIASELALLDSTAVIAPTRSPVVEAAAVPETGGSLPPRVRKLAAEHGIDISALTGTGPGGRVTGDDVLRAAAERSAGVTAATSVAAVTARPAGYESLPVEVRPNSPRRRTIARRLSEVASTVPQLTADMQIDMGAVLDARERRKAAGGKAPSMLACIASAAVGLLAEEHALLNASWTEENTLLWRTVNLGIAIDTPDGLIVPVIRDATSLKPLELDSAISDLAARARAGGLNAADLEGGTFTISNPGSIGPVLRAEALLNAPQVALLGLPGLVHAPVAIAEAGGGHRVDVRPLLRASLTFDHRALDGGSVIRFLSALCEALERWD